MILLDTDVLIAHLRDIRSARDWLHQATGSVSQRAQPFLGAFGAERDQWSGNLTFGTRAVFTSDRRARLIQLRDGGDSPR